MLIERNHTIRIAARREVTDLFRGMERGAILQGRIVGRPGGNAAVLLMGGTRLRAEFPGGLPPGNAIAVRLISSDAAGIVLKLVDPARTNAANRLMDFMLFGIDDPGRVLRGLRHMAGEPFSILALNEYLRGDGRPAPRKGPSGAASILNLLAAKGIPTHQLLSLYYLNMIGCGISPDLIIFFLRILGRDGRTLPWLKKMQTPGDLEREIETAGSAVEQMIDDGTLPADLAADSLSWLLEGVRGERGVYGFDMPFADGETHRECRVLLSPNGVLLSVAFSHIGTLEILVRVLDSGLSIDLFADGDAGADALKQGIENLHAAVGRSGLRLLSLAVHKKDDVRQKIIDIISLLAPDSTVDIKA